MKKSLLIILTIFLFKLGFSFSNVGTKDGKFVDENGNELMFHGINLVCKSQAKGFLSFYEESHFKDIKESGFNCIRLGIIWAGIEPKPNVINYDYLNKVAQQIKWAEKYGLYVILDMHQDLYSQVYADGAPKWATLTDGHKHTKTALWSDAYHDSKAVIASFDNFWNNTKAVDNIGIQDHYIKVLTELGKKFNAHKNLLGYDIMNEPFSGSNFLKEQEAMFVAYFKYKQETEPGKFKTIEELLAVWGTPEGKMMLLNELNDTKLYKRLVANAEPLVSQFVNSHLISFYTKAYEAIRTYDKENIVFFEHTYSSNMGIPFNIELPGQAEYYNIAYAPHAYDLTVDTELLHTATKNRVNFIFDGVKQNTKKLNLPSILGEWGALPNDKKNLATLKDLLVNIEKLRCSNTFWHYHNNFKNSLLTKYLNKPYPIRIGGELKSYKTDNDKLSAEFEWKSNGSETIIYFPKSYKTKLDALKSDKNYKIQEDKMSGGYLLKIKSLNNFTRFAL